MKSIHISNIITNTIVRVVLTVCITLLIFKFENLWLTVLYLIPGCIMAMSITEKETEKKGESDESKGNEQAR